MHHLYGKETMKIVIETQGTLAIYEQIVNQIKNAVIAGEVEPGEALPSIRSLAADLLQKNIPVLWRWII